MILLKGLLNVLVAMLVITFYRNENAAESVRENGKPMY